MRVEGTKGFHPDFRCLGKQYCTGATFTVDGELSLCENGIHFCEIPIGVFAFYPPMDSRYADVEARGEVIRDPDTDDDSGNWCAKACTNELRVLNEKTADHVVQDSIHWMAVHWSVPIDREQAFKYPFNDISLVSEERVYSQSSADLAVGCFKGNCLDNMTGYVSVVMEPLSIARNRKSCGSIAISFAGESAAVCDGICGTSVNLGVNSVAITRGDYGIVRTASFGRGETYGSYSAAMSQRRSTMIVLHGDDSVAITDGSVIVHGEGCIVLLTFLDRHHTIQAVKGTRLIMHDPHESTTERLEFICGTDDWPADTEIAYIQIYDNWRTKHER